MVVGSLDERTIASLRLARVAAVYDGRGAGGIAPPEAFGLSTRVLARPLRVGDVLARSEDALLGLRDIADQHRGETVVVLADGPPGDRVDVRIDADGVSISPADARQR